MLIKAERGKGEAHPPPLPLFFFLVCGDWVRQDKTRQDKGVASKMWCGCGVVRKVGRGGGRGERKHEKKRGGGGE